MKNAIIAAVVAALVSSAGGYAAITRINGHMIAVHSIPADRLMPKSKAIFEPHPLSLKGPLVTVQPGQTAASVVNCPTGYTATGGGYMKSLDNSVVVNDEPMGLLRPVGWLAQVQNSTTKPVGVQAYIVCIPS